LINNTRIRRFPLGSPQNWQNWDRGRHCKKLTGYDAVSASATGREGRFCSKKRGLPPPRGMFGRQTGRCQMTKVAFMAVIRFAQG
jgi:hypothetical protein